jgi:hypothetical protein
MFLSHNIRGPDTETEVATRTQRHPLEPGTAEKKMPDSQLGGSMTRWKD